jgi:hypothetical protein
MGSIKPSELPKAVHIWCGQILLLQNSNPDLWVDHACQVAAIKYDACPGVLGLAAVVEA